MESSGFFNHGVFYTVPFGFTVILFLIREISVGIHSLSIQELVSCAYGTQRKEKESKKLEVDEKPFRQQVLRLIFCRIDRGTCPLTSVGPW